jgi:hypothetical protein
LLVELAIALLAAIAGFTKALWLVLLRLIDGSMDIEGDLDPNLGKHTKRRPNHSPFIPMLNHLNMTDEMVD